jgi:hypothetical protein
MAAQAQLPLLVLLSVAVAGRLQGGSIAARSSHNARAAHRAAPVLGTLRLRGGEQRQEPSGIAADGGEVQRPVMKSPLYFDFI